MNTAVNEYSKVYIDHSHYATKEVSEAVEGSIQMRFQDMAYDSVNDVVGILYFDPLHGNVKLAEQDRSSGEWDCQTVDYGSFGDTSLTYDSNGDPHVAYFAINQDLDDEPEADEGSGGIIHSDETPRASSALNVAGATVYYRKRQSGTWQTQEIIENGQAYSQMEHNIHLDRLGRPYVILSSSPFTTSGTLPLGVPAHIKRTGVDTWTKNVLPVSHGLTNHQLDSVGVTSGLNHTCYVTIWDQIDGDLDLAIGSDSSWTIVNVVSGDVQGYPSIVPLTATTLGISYMSAPDNKLVYGVWNTFTSTWTELHESAADNTGFQSELALDDAGRPIVVSISKDDQSSLLTWFDGSNFHEKLLVPTYANQFSGLDLTYSNTVRITLADETICLVGFMPHGGMRYCEMEFNP